LFPNIFIDNNEILEQVQDTKFLGLIIDENLSWDNHVSHIMSKTSSGLYALRRMANQCEIDGLKTIYYALIHSHIAYGISIYGATKKENLDRILVQQKKALRIILNLKHLDSVKHIFSNLNILTVYGLYIFETIKFVYTKSNPTLELKRHKYNTRNSRFVKKHILVFYEKSTEYSGRKYFDCLPGHIKKEQNSNKFLKNKKFSDRIGTIFFRRIYH